MVAWNEVNIKRNPVLLTSMKSGTNKLPIRLCFVSQWRFDDLKNMPGKPISEARRIAQEVERVVFICYNDHGEFLHSKIGDNLYVYTVPFQMNDSICATVRNMITQFIVMGAFLSKVVKLHKIDFIRAENVILGGIPTVMSSILTSSKYAIWLAGFEERVIRIRYGEGILAKIIQGLLILSKKIVLSNAEFVVSVSSDLIKVNNRYSRKPFIITPNFVDLDEFKLKDRRSQKNQRLHFLFVGRLESEKGIQVLIDSIQAINHRSDFILCIVGWGTMLPQVKKAINDGLNIEYLGKFSHEKMPEVFAQHDMLIVPSLTEGMPAVILEAFATGIPVIASKVGQVSDFVRDGQDGILIKPGSIEDLKAAMLDVIEDRKRIDAMGESAYKQVVKISGGYVSLHRRMYQHFVPKLSKGT